MRRKASRVESGRRTQTAGPGGEPVESGDLATSAEVC